MSYKTIAEEYLARAAAVQAERGKHYDKDNKQQERSMQKIVTMFNTLTGKDLNDTEGWLFMIILKMVRAQAKPGVHHDDTWLDLVSYAALAAEQSSIEFGLAGTCITGLPTGSFSLSSSSDKAPPVSAHPVPTWQIPPEVIDVGIGPSL